MIRAEKGYKIHLLHLVQSLRIGGAEILLLHYIRALGLESYKHYVYSFGGDGPIRKKIEALGVKVRIGPKRETIKAPLKFGLSLLILIKDLLRFIKSSHIQIIHSHLGHANQLAVAIGKLAAIPAFPTVHNTMAFEDRRGCRDPRVYFIKAVDAVIYRIADSVLSVSDEIKETILRIYRLKVSRVVTVKNGIVFENSIMRPLDLQREFPGSEDKLKLIAVGALSYQKAFEVLVRAVSEAVKFGFDDFLVLVVGVGENRHNLEKLIRHLGVENYVKLLGLRQDVIQLMRACDLFVMPSRYEGLSIAMIEAMACGLPIIASDAPGLRYYVINDQNGLLFPVEDHTALAQRVIRLAQDKNLRCKLSQGARNCFENEYDMRKNIKALDALFRKYAATTH